MKIYNLDGKVIKWKLEGYSLGHVPTPLCSKGHLKVREILLELFPTEPILEELLIPELNLKLDFFVPRRKLAIEIDGQQHDKHVPFFHKTKQDFLHAKTNDKLKNDWCEINEIKLVRLKWDEEDKWKNQLS